MAGSDDKGFMGIDWDGDGKVSASDDVITWAMLDEEDESHGGQQSCMAFLLLLPVHLIFGLLEKLIHL